MRFSLSEIGRGAKGGEEGVNFVNDRSDERRKKVGKKSTLINEKAISGFGI